MRTIQRQARRACVIGGPGVRNEPVFAPRLSRAALRELAGQVLLASRGAHPTIANRAGISQPTAGSDRTALEPCGRLPGGCIRVVFADNRRRR
jgi:hypothetical protein